MCGCWRDRESESCVGVWGERVSHVWVFVFNCSSCEYEVGCN